MDASTARTGITGTGLRRGGLSGSFVRRYLPFYLLFIPVLVYYLIFAYAPMGGLIIAFKDYTFNKGVFGSDWAGLKHFQRFLTNPTFWMVIGNTFRLALLRIAIGFPIPIILAIMLNELKNLKYKKLVQTLVYMPHFLSWVIIYGFLFSFFSSNGLINQMIMALGGGAVPFMSTDRYYDALFIGSATWKEMGWGTIIYLAALSNIDSELLEAAGMDGAGRLRRIWHVVLPGIRMVIAIKLILSFGEILTVSFEQTLTMMNDSVRSRAEVIDYYIYRMGILSANNYSFSTAVGLFRNIISLMLVLLTNKLVKMVEEDGALW